MSTRRFDAIKEFSSRSKVVTADNMNIQTSSFGENVFNTDTIRRYVSSDAYDELIVCMNDRKKPTKELANQIAVAMKTWALSKGASHYTHWFQPMTGSTAEKHISLQNFDFLKKSIEEFNGDALIQLKPDTGNLPTDSSRSTFEARGFSTWDISSPAFIINIGSGSTLCIPTVFISYKGESLDYKGPLLKSIQKLEEAALDVCQYFDRNINKIIPTLGWEQEYFLIDYAMYYARPDLMTTGRTLQGRKPAKGQQKDEHYFGSIPERVYAFMKDFETEAHKLGIPMKARHNEMAPGQYECTPVYEEVNLAVDHNLLLQDIMDRLSSKHKLKAIMHEKPFEGLSGSGKHLNWSLMTDNGRNLLSPGTTPRTNLQFLTFFINTLVAINEHEDLIRASFANPGNELRLGIDEAPPHIMSVFIGKNLTEVLEIIEKRIDEDTFDEQENIALRMDLHNKIPTIFIDNTDTNRTAPIAFTGDKFELRSMGASGNCSSAMIVLNTIVASQLAKFKDNVDELIKIGDYKDVAILKVLKREVEGVKRILFEGDNYSKKWLVEAKKRNITDKRTTPEALSVYLSDKNIELFSKMKIYTKAESKNRYDVLVKNYIQTKMIESKILSEMAINKIIPAAIKYQQNLISLIKDLKQINIKQTTSLMSLVENIAEYCDTVIKIEKEMTENRLKIAETTNLEEAVELLSKTVIQQMNEIRDCCDKLEFYIDDELWPLPKYNEILLTK